MQLDGDLIRRHRTTLGLTQAQLAKKAGYDTRTIQRAEAGTPVLNQAAATIAQALEVRLDQIIPRQESLFDISTASETNTPEVILLPCSSGKDFHRHLTKTDFIAVESDFEPRAEHRDAVKRFGALIDTVWENPWAPTIAGPDTIPTQEEIFEQMITAGEILGGLAKLGLRVMLGSYTVRQPMIHYTEFSEAYIRTNSPYDTDYSKLIICLTDALDETLRRTPDDHYLSEASRRQWQLDEEIPF